MNDKEPLPASEVTRQTLYARAGELLLKDGFQLDVKRFRSDAPSVQEIIIRRFEDDTRQVIILYDIDQNYAYQTQTLCMSADNEVRYFDDIRIPMTDEIQAVIDEGELASQSLKERATELRSYGFMFPGTDSKEYGLVKKLDMIHELLSEAKNEDDRAYARRMQDEILEQLKLSTERAVPEATVAKIAQLPEEIQVLVQDFLFARSRLRNASEAFMSMDAELSKQVREYVAKNRNGLILTEADAWNVLRVLDSGYEWG